MRSPLARAIGLGSAREGVGSWLAERVSAVALVPLTLWFVASIIPHTSSDYATFIAWLRTPVVETSSRPMTVVRHFSKTIGSSW
jgi:succinate dehydrogenase / fumarate reductase membrane anchor subunit